MPRTKVFISYSRKDQEWLDRVREQLDVLQREGLVDVFEDTRIGVGEDWLDRLNEEMLNAHLAMLLISAPFLSSAFIRDQEVPPLFERHGRGGMVLYPLLLRDCPWQEVEWLARLQMRPSGGKSVASRRGESRTECLANVAREIADIVKGNAIPKPRPSPAARPTSPSAAPTSDTQAIRLDRVMPLLEQLTECFHTHRMMFGNYLRAMLNKASLEDEFETRRLKLDEQAVLLIAKLAIYLPTQLRWTINRLRRVLSCSWQQPRDLYYTLLEACGSFPRAPIEAAGRLYDEVMNCYLEMGSLYFEQVTDPVRYQECLTRHRLGEAAKTLRDDVNSEVALKLILEHEYYGSEDKAKALASCKT